MTLSSVLEYLVLICCAILKDKSENIYFEGITHLIGTYFPQRPLEKQKHLEVKKNPNYLSKRLVVVQPTEKDCRGT